MLEWYWVLLIIFGCLLVLMAAGIPVAMCFMIINVVGVIIFFGGWGGLEQLVLSFYSSLASFTLLPLPLFVLMGVLLFRCQLTDIVMDAVDKWIGRLPGRLSFLAVASGTLFAALTGSSQASTAVLGSALVPEMVRRGYSKSMSIGPIVGSGGLAIMIPPSGIAIFMAAIAELPVGRLLIAIIIPGVMMAFIYGVYIIVRSYLQPESAPPYEVIPSTLLTKLLTTLKGIVPVAVIVFMVIGVVLMGVATPSEAAACGAIGTFVLAAAYKRLTIKVITESIGETLKISGMILLIIAAAAVFGQILSASGATRGLGEFATGLQAPPIVIIIAMQIVGLILGCFMSVAAIIMITIPIFIPVVNNLGFDPIWFAVLYMINMEIGFITPPLGINLYVMKSVAPPGTTINEIISAGIPYIILAIVAMALVMVFPVIALWLPGLMH